MSSGKKPSKNATEQEIAIFRERQKKEKMSAVGIERIITLREELNKDGFSDKKLILSVDGSYTNETVLRRLPAHVELIGRIRKDAKIYALPESRPTQKGRKRYYGDQLPTPEQIRHDTTIPYQPIEAWAAGKMRTFDVKIVKDIRWRKSADKNLMLIIIRPVSYRLTKKSKLLYRNPAYLITTNQDIDLRLLIQAYIRRWEIEVGFRDQKTLIGCGQAQVREKVAVEKVPAFISACYGLMLIASHTANLQQNNALPGAKWYVNLLKPRISTGDILNRFRAERWLESIKINFSDFVNIEKKLAKLGKTTNSCTAAIFYNRN